MKEGKEAKKTNKQANESTQRVTLLKNCVFTLMSSYDVIMC